jgi:serine/threonine protein phosphatase 1
MSGESDFLVAVGDIHGQAHLLRDLQERIGALATKKQATRPKVVYLGDYIDRGPDSRGVVELLLKGLPDFERVYLKGNHEDMLHGFLYPETQAFTPQSSARAFFVNGGLETIGSYLNGSDAPQAARAFGLVELASALRSSHILLEEVDFLRDIVLAHMPNAHQKFFSELAISHETASHLFVHAGLRPRRALAEQEIEDMLWIRDPFLTSDWDWGKRVVHGHTPHTSGPTLHPNRVNLDSGAFASGILTAGILSPDGVDFVVGADRRAAGTWGASMSSKKKNSQALPEWRAAVEDALRTPAEDPRPTAPR